MNSQRRYTVIFKDPHPVWGGETRVIRYAHNWDEVIAWCREELADIRASYGIETEILNYRGDTVWASLARSA